DAASVLLLSTVTLSVAPVKQSRPLALGKKDPRTILPRKQTMPVPRYVAAACQTDFANPVDRTEIPNRVGHMLGMIDRAVVGYRPFGDVKLIVFPEFAHAAPIYENVDQLLDKLAIPIPNEHTDRYH